MKGCDDDDCCLYVEASNDDRFAIDEAIGQLAPHSMGRYEGDLLARICREWMEFRSRGAKPSGEQEFVS